MQVHNIKFDKTRLDMISKAEMYSLTLPKGEYNAKIGDYFDFGNEGIMFRVDNIINVFLDFQKEEIFTVPFIREQFLIETEGFDTKREFLYYLKGCGYSTGDYITYELNYGFVKSE